MKTQTLKLNLEDITVQSFVTSVEENNNTIIGGLICESDENYSQCAINCGSMANQHGTCS